ncbi:P-type conjugative transfer protein TrbJ [Verticiella sediminum]|uniref:P-type conjugative transfer protein TrbJ n=2 Tax=Verticiella sediminum TaxID=1247510 RepID=A0A556AD37_9BURK|nr:P-type conjugative transfer protein TrbJ [Verticiella sediminum]TSH90806.1 P-type conjugative transfer protein TrbJ [Verticiella sediminum]
MHAKTYSPLSNRRELLTTRSQNLAAKIALTVVAALGIVSMPAHAGIPVIDGTNLSQTTVTAIQQVAQVQKQIEQYSTQLQQYENMLQNTAAPAAYIWDQAQSTINGLMQSIDTLNNLTNQAGSLDAYLGKFQDVSYYKSSPCFTSAGCSDTERTALEKTRALASQSQKAANDALFKGIKDQQDNLKSDARQLERLQSQAQGAKGQMEAIGYANQIASQQSNQLQQIRGLLLAQQNAIGAQLQARTDREAQQEAAHKASTESRIGKTPNPKNWLQVKP